MSRWFSNATTLLSAAYLVACTNASNHLQVDTAARATSTAAVDEHVVIGSSGLGHVLDFGEVVSRREGMLLRAQVEIQNNRKHTVQFEYRWEWTDSQGFQLGDTLSAWQPATIAGGDHKLMSSTGPGPAAANFRLYLRRPGS